MNSNTHRTALAESLLTDVYQARERIKPYCKATPLQSSDVLSAEYSGSVYLKREDQQPIRSFKIRGALNKILSLSVAQQQQGIVCASAGNHAQGIAYACRLLKLKGHVFLPENTPAQKIERVRWLGRGFCQVSLHGKNFADCEKQAKQYALQSRCVFAHPFDDSAVMAGQGTLALELLAQHSKPFDCVLVPVGGGGLLAGVSAVLKTLSPSTRIVGVEVEGADALAQSLQYQQRITLPQVDGFADGTAVSALGELPFQYAQRLVDDVIVLTKHDVSRALIKVYNSLGMVVEPSGVLSIAALPYLPSSDFHKVCCIVSGGNNEASRFSEFFELLNACP